MTIRKRLIGFAIHAAVVWGFLLVAVAAGHGVGIIGMLMVQGSVDYWGIPIMVGWTGILLLAIAAIAPWRWFYAAATISGLAIVFTSWCLFLAKSESIGMSIISSYLFFGLTICRLIYFRGELRSWQRRPSPLA